MSKPRQIIGRLAILALGLAAGLVIWQHQAISDWWVLHSYRPTGEVVAFVSDDSLTAEGKRLLYLGQAQIDDKTAFNSDCPIGELRQTLVLGCFTGSRIYILEIDRPQLTGVMSVTAAHEMLHNAYARLSAAKRDQVNAWITNFYPTIHSTDLTQLIKDYKQSEPGELLNELHSILPTEVATLSPELEDYYKQYFNDRKLVVAAFEDYQSVFEKLDTQRNQLLATMSSLKTQIDSLESQYAAAANQAAQLADQIASLRAQGKTAQSNQLVPAQNQTAEQANSLAIEIKNLISEYNQDVTKVNQLALEQNDLIQSLDSHQYTNQY